ncbi:MAG: exodeoxyribonuclease VII large subunit [Saprospirales bacterium]|nr:MAG: exodeoxyribonuclease VII large subunit [Saprospirales bacterium]
MADFTELNPDKTNPEGISLQELTNRIKRVVALNFASPIWVRAEIASLKTSRGHRYLDLVQKEVETDSVLARVQANLWSGTYIQLSKRMKEDIDLIIKEGQEVLLEVKVNFHSQYGLSIQVVDIDPDFTIGKYFTKKQQLFARILKEKLNEPQKSLQIPLVVQRIAIISSPTAAGYIDFITQIEHVSDRMHIQLDLYKNSMQGSTVENDLIQNLEKIETGSEPYDLIVIIRGGGAKLDLMDFDNYILAKKIAHYPIPVLTGIGHEIDISALDVVAAISQKTPTAAAQYIINKNDEFISRIEIAKLKIAEAAVNQLQEHKRQLERTRTELTHSALNFIREKKHQLAIVKGELLIQSRFQLQKTAETLRQLTREFQISNPENVLKRGFAIFSKDGKIVSDSNDIREGDKVEVRLFKGRAESTVTKTYQS